MYDTYLSFLMLILLVKVVTVYEKHVLFSTIFYAVGALLLRLVYVGVSGPFSPTPAHYLLFFIVSLALVGIYFIVLYLLIDRDVLWWVAFIPGILLPFWIPGATNWTARLVGA